MSYIVARKVDQEEPVGAEYGFTLSEIDIEDRKKNTLDSNLDDELLGFVLGLIQAVDDLAEGEALVVWKEIF
jgi:hypothetical protein